MPVFQGIWHRNKMLLLAVLGIVILIAGWFFFGHGWWNNQRLGRELSELQTSQEYGDRAERIVELRDSLRQDPNNVELLLSLGNNWKQIGDFTKNDEHYQHALAAYQSAYRASGEKNSLAVSNQGTVYVLQRDFVRAEQAFRLAIEKNPGEPDYYVRLVEVLRFAEAAPEAIIDVYRQGLEQLVENAPMVQDLAQYLYDTGRYADALTYYKLLASKYEGFDNRVAEIEQKIATGQVPTLP